MSEKRTFGIKSVKLGDIPDDGTMSTVLAQLALTYKDSASIKEADPTTTDFWAEEEDFPIESINEQGDIMIAWSITDLTDETLETLKAGTVVGGGWEMSRVIVNIEKALQIISKRDILFEVPRAKITAVINIDLGKAKIGLVDIKAKVLLPKNPVVSPLGIKTYTAPVVDAGDAQSVAVAVHIATLTGTATPFRGTATYQWTVKSKPNGADAPVMATPAALVNNVTGLTTVGDYVFTLTATDSNGYSASDDVTITITA
ncbi:hypothetical protein [Mucilaginibacter sp. L3T2-6]|uniref:PKD domain-containing protein n=1 Tax=Mucilaginibacter sp. L3T2-6 TaxID=3062491 RepID=UPI0026774450|nr:hypothetical protein [Mucilaginibacter sp. L3T2-6]MDO3641975.1 hypothetical protein [Mucilaginibacter sp. L3T2-6]MDV6214347.1 hypothetical protein [Mucilaginibacter sp. L3T2-6]